MDVVEIIRKKRDGSANDDREISFLVDGISNGRIPDYQAAAWLMAVYHNGLDPIENRALTQALIESGRVVEHPRIAGFKVDKHSTGGVGDKTSPILAPIVAAAGAYVPMISGRGLGHSGGTLDKLESIPGFQVDLSLDRFEQLVAEVGFALIGQTRELAPGDGILYSLRDVTATVECVPLIVSSIISKKAAEGIDGLVLDVKTGDGAFMKTLQEAELLACSLVEAGKILDKRIVALITDMSQPLGRMVGNAMEMMECFETLKGQGPSDVTELSLELSARMLLMAGLGEDLEGARRLAREQIENGRALEKLRQLIRAQGGDARVADDYSLFPEAGGNFEYTASQSGYLTAIRADRVGRAAVRLGAGRQTVDSGIDPAVGIELLNKVGDPVEKGQPLAIVRYNHDVRLAECRQWLDEAFGIGPERVDPPPLIRKVIG